MKGFIVVLCSMLLMVNLLTSCDSQEKLVNRMYSNLEKSANMEKEFANKQQALEKLSQDEQAIYSKITSLTIHQEKQITKNIEEAKKYNADRKQLLQETKESFDEAYKCYKSIKPDVKEISEAKRKEKATHLIQLMEKRHDLMETYYNQYLELLKLNENLYAQMQQKELNATEIDKQIKSLNQENTEMKKTKKQFNQYTQKYNKAKKQFYQNAAGA